MKTALQRRTFLSYCSRAGFAATLFPGVLWALNEEKGPITKELIGEAATVAGIAITPEQSDMMLKDLNDGLKDYEAIHALKIPNDVPPAFRFDPVLPGMKIETEKRPMRISRANAERRAEKSRRRRVLHRAPMGRADPRQRKSLPSPSPRCTSRG